MAEHPIEGMMNTTLEKIKEMVDVNSVIGDPITTPGGTTIIPITKISYGFASGGSDLPVKTQDKQFFGGATGAGVTVNPVAFLTVTPGGEVRLLRVDPGNTSVDRLIDLAPDVMNKIGSLFGKGKKQKQEPETAPESVPSADEDVE